MTPVRIPAGFAGTQLTPDDPGYAEAIRLFNGAVNKRPALVARCANEADVVAAVRFAREQSLPLSVRAGGHNVSGNALVDGGLVIDLRSINGVEVDPVNRIARAGAGATWSQFDRATQAHGLATTGGAVSTTGIAGLTLGGGIGWLMRMHGLACDNLIGARMVTAEGEIVTVGPDQPELLWGLRGGGGNFGVVTRLDYRLHPVDSVWGGMIIFPQARAVEVLGAVRAINDVAPDNLMTMAVLGTHPEAGPIVGALVGGFGDNAAAERIAAPLRALEPVADLLGPMKYVELQSMLDPLLSEGFYHYWKSNFLTRLDDEVAAAMQKVMSAAPTPFCQIVIEQFSGEAARVPVDATAFAQRNAPYNMAILGMSAGPEDYAAARDWARATWRALEPFCAEGVYLNYLGSVEEEGAQRVRDAWGADTLARLAALKAVWDPANVFRSNQNVTPALLA